MTAETPPTPRTWWQWLVVYPALATMVLGALPTAWQAFRAWRLDVSYSKVQIAEAQQRMWEKNLDCLSAKPVYSITLLEGVTVGVTLCPSGDALLRYESQWATVSYTWIPFPPGVQQRPQATRQVPACDLPGAWAGIGLRVACAMDAQERPGAPAPLPTLPHERSRIIWGATRCVGLRGGLTWRIYSTDGRACVLEHIQVSTGQVVSRAPVPCTTPCPP